MTDYPTFTQLAQVEANIMRAFDATEARLVEAIHAGTRRIITLSVVLGALSGLLLAATLVAMK